MHPIASAVKSLHNTSVPKQPRQPDPLLANVAAFIDAADLIPPRATVVVGVSGGGDSVALLSILRELGRSSRRRWRLIAAHLNHQLRGGADEDEAFVRDLARRWRIELVVERIDVRKLARERGAGIEEAARDARYDFFLRAGRSSSATVVAAGHHADDNVETVLHRLARGTHLRGLAGMPPRRPLDQHGDLLLVRPLLQVRREQIEDYLKRHRLKWRTDPTNVDTHFQRNLIRHELLPVLRKLNPQADAAILRLARSAGEVESYLAARGRAALAYCQVDQANPGLGLAAERLAELGDVVGRIALRAELERLRLPMAAVTARTLEELAALASGRKRAVNLPGGLVARRLGPAIVFEPAAPPPPPSLEAIELACPGRTRLPDGRVIVCRVEPFSPQVLERHRQVHRLGVELLDADKVHGPLVCRTRRSGDVFHPLGNRGRKSVSDFLTDLKLPQPQRAQVLCVCDRDGIVYLAPLRIAHRVRLGDSARRVIRLELVETQGRQPDRPL